MLRVAVLGPMVAEVYHGDQRVDVTPRTGREQMALAALALAVPGTLTVDALADALYGDAEVRGVRNAIQAVVSRVLDGIRFEGGQVDLDFERKVNVFDKLERDSEVFNRLEDDYTKGFENWQKNTKGLGDDFDKDFSDLSGAL